MEVDFDVKNTGQKKTINGFDTHQVVMTITVREKGKTLEESGGLVLTADMWLAPKIAAMKEIADFDMRYAQKLYGSMIEGVSAEQMAAVDGALPDDEATPRSQDGRRGRQDGRHRHPDDDDADGGEVGRADGGRGEAEPEPGRRQVGRRVGRQSEA